MNGAVNFLKPPGMTSSDAVVWLRRVLGEKKCGHGGTLDPAAAGVLPILVGRGTRLFSLTLGHRKTYCATLFFGCETSTLDQEGDVTAVTDAVPTRGEVAAALPAFVGVIAQTPPAYSALSVGGRRAYELARSGRAVELPSRSVEIFSLELMPGGEGEAMTLRVACASGTYIRTLAADIARSLGSLAHLSALTRVQSGRFDIADALSVEEIQTLADGGRAARAVTPLDALLEEYPRLVVRPGAYKRAVNGARLADNDVNWDGLCGTRRLVDGDERLISLCEARETSAGVDVAQTVMLL